jgi:hypothetical protein
MCVRAGINKFISSKLSAAAGGLIHRSVCALCNFCAPRAVNHKGEPRVFMKILHRSVGEYLKIFLSRTYGHKCCFNNISILRVFLCCYLLFKILGNLFLSTINKMSRRKNFKHTLLLCYSKREFCFAFSYK